VFELLHSHDASFVATSVDTRGCTLPDRPGATACSLIQGFDFLGLDKPLGFCNTSKITCG
jgi:hypothetical protein